MNKLKKTYKQAILIKRDSGKLYTDIYQISFFLTFANNWYTDKTIKIHPGWIRGIFLFSLWTTDLVLTEGQGWVVWPVSGVDCSPVCICWYRHSAVEIVRETSSSLTSCFDSCWRYLPAWAEHVKNKKN